MSLEEVRQRACAIAAIEEARARAEGIDIREDSFLVETARAITNLLRDELGLSEYARIYRQVWNEFIEHASVEGLRRLAELKSSAGEHGAALHLTMITDYREWEARQ